VEEHYRRQYYEAIDSTIATIEKWPGYVMYCNLEGVQIKAARQQDFSAEFQAVTDFYGDDLQASSLSAQLTTFGSQFTDSPDLVTLNDCHSYLRSTMGQERLNHLMLLHLHKEKLDDFDFVYIANEFVKGCEHRLSFFGKFN